MIDEDEIRRHYELLRPRPDERGRRLFAATQVRAVGYGGIAAVARATGIAPSTIGRGLKEFDAGIATAGVRRPGGGRKRLAETDATLAPDLLSLVESATLGDPMRPLLWVSKSLGKLAAALREMGHRISANTVRRLLRTLGFSRQGNFKANEGRNHPDRDVQFEHINTQVLALQAAGQPVVSVDTKKKELIGNYKNAGTDWRPKGRPRRVNGHDFEDKLLGKATVATGAGLVAETQPSPALAELFHQFGDVISAVRDAPSCRTSPPRVPSATATVFFPYPSRRHRAR